MEKNNNNDLRQCALSYHRYPHPGKIEVVPTKPFENPYFLSLAYSPGVAYPCLEIAKDSRESYLFTGKGNTVAVVSNGTAVLGLGNIGAQAAKPVMEGKALLFKVFAGIDAFDIEVDEKDPQKIIEIVRAISPTFGGINLEDIKAPECFEIEKGLVEKCNIPVMHDDQHGTAVIVAAAMINALDIQGKTFEHARIVVNGAGAAASACTRLLISLGARKENIVMCDSKGVITVDRTDLTPAKAEFATERTDLHTLAQAMRDSDVFLGLSVANVVTSHMLKTMAPRPIVFALANPDPEINRDIALKTREDLIIATGRSDYPNQINNVLGFPYIFRGALDCRARRINEEMKIAAARAIAELAREEVPRKMRELYDMPAMAYGPEYILPKPYDSRLLPTVSAAVALAAEQSGVAETPIDDLKKYKSHLERFVKQNDERFKKIFSI